MNFQKFQLKWKISNHFTSPKMLSAWRKLFIPPPDKSFLRFWNKNFRTAIYSNTQTIAFQVLRKCRFWTSRNNAGQFFFLTLTIKMFLVCCGSIFFWVYLFIFCWDYVTLLLFIMVTFLARLCWLWNSLPENEWPFS